MHTWAETDFASHAEWFALESGEREQPTFCAYVISYVESVNRVAEAIATSHPTVMVDPLIYSQPITPFPIRKSTSDWNDDNVWMS